MSRCSSRIVVAFAVGSFLPPLSLIYAEPQKVLAVLGAALLIVLIGIADDIWDLDWFTKLAGQIIAAGLLAWQGVQIGWFPVPGTLVLLSPYLSLLLTIFVIVLVMNAVNFIDGLDGLVAGVATIASGAFFIYGYLVSYGPTDQSEYFNLAQFITAALIGACLGFLPWNWRRSDDRPARLFMGDAGALLVGLLMATSTVALVGRSTSRDAESGDPGLHPGAAAARGAHRSARRLHPRGAASAAGGQVAVQCRPQAPAPPAARHGPLARARRHPVLRLDGRRLGRDAAVPDPGSRGRDRRESC